MDIRTGHLQVLKSIGLKFAVCVDLDDNYQGSEAAVVVREKWSSYLDADEPVGLVIVGYGSCSGCDEWSDLDGQPLEKLNAVLRVYNNIKWFDNLADLQSYIAGAPVGEDSWSSDHDLQWYGSSTNFPRFQGFVAALRTGDPLEGADE